MSSRYVNTICHNYVNHTNTELHSTGRKIKVIDEYTGELIINVSKAYPLSEPMAIQDNLVELGIKNKNIFIYQSNSLNDLLNETL